MLKPICGFGHHEKGQERYTEKPCEPFHASELKVNETVSGLPRGFKQNPGCEQPDAPRFHPFRKPRWTLLSLFSDFKGQIHPKHHHQSSHQWCRQIQRFSNVTSIRNRLEKRHGFRPARCPEKDDDGNVKTEGQKHPDQRDSKFHFSQEKDGQNGQDAVEHPPSHHISGRSMPQSTHGAYATIGCRTTGLFNGHIAVAGEVTIQLNGKQYSSASDSD